MPEIPGSSPGAPTMKPRLIIFDFYGTLAYQDRKLKREDFFAFYKKIGIEFKSESEVKLFISFFSQIFGYSQNWLDFCQRLVKKFLKKEDPKIIQTLANFYKENIVYKLHDDVKEIIHLPVEKAILTDSPPFLLESLGLQKFAKIFTPRETKFLKPDERVFLTVLENLNKKPEEALMVGDDIERDLLPAQKIGMQTMLIDRENKIKNSPFKKINSLIELKNILI